MVHRKHVGLAAVVITLMTLMIVSTSMVAAQVPVLLPTVTPMATGEGPVRNGDGNGDGNGGTMNPTATATAMAGGGGDMMMAPSRPSSNSIVLHPATPIQLVAAGGGLHCYFIAPDGATRTGPYIESFSNLAEMYPSGDAVTLYSGSNPGSGKPVTILYLPAEQKLRISTYYPDSPPYDFNKPYIFTVDADHSITHESW